ncbi:MAG: DUF262 domain-containing protein [Planctomycetota bacterium]|nr:DUF262 domain-containing protein [Planctomycetota bacterium]
MGTLSFVDAQAARLDNYWAKWTRDEAGDISREHPMKVWQTARTQYKVSDFITWQRDGSLILSPKFQRRPVWKPGAKSYLLDTIIRGLPIPIIFLRELRSDLKTFKPQREVVDGQQRIRTLISFVAPNILPHRTAHDEFQISKVHNKEYGDKSFRDLPAEIQNQILDYQFSVHVFPSDTGDSEILQIFARMNATGVKLNAQELRNAEFFGEYKTLAYALAAEQLKRWEDWDIFNADHIARMAEVELTSEFMVLILKGVSEKRAKTITDPYRDYDKTFDAGPEVAKRFRQVFEAINELFAAEAATSFHRRTLFYALFGAVYDLQFGLESPLKPMKAKPLIQKDIEHIRAAGKKIAISQAPDDIMAATTRRTSHVRERKSLIEYVKGGK